MSKLIIKNLEKRYKSRKVVKNVSLEIEQGEVVGLLGPNGAGKTTCFYMIIGLVQPDSGKILLDQYDLTPLAIHKRARLGLSYLPQETSVFRKLTVEENILSILQLQKDLTKDEQRKKLTQLLNEFHIHHLRTASVMSLSGGEKRRVEIARALATNPKFILLDEPFAGVDPISIIDIKKIITQLSQRNIGVLITDHNVRETLDICQHSYIVGEGTIIAKGTSEQILDNKLVRDTYLGDAFHL